MKPRSSGKKPYVRQPSLFADLPKTEEEIAQEAIDRDPQDIIDAFDNFTGIKTEPIPVEVKSNHTLEEPNKKERKTKSIDSGGARFCQCEKEHMSFEEYCLSCGLKWKGYGK
jgi:hypothetical protein